MKLVMHKYLLRADLDGIYKNKRGILSMEESKCIECKYIMEFNQII